VSEINKNLHQERKSYDQSTLRIQTVDKDPIKQFDQWYCEADSFGDFEANAMVISTVGMDGRPSSRVVLLKEYSNEGLIFFSNYDSRKGREMAANNAVSVLFFYEQMQRQIRIDGRVEKISEKASEDYFKTRPIESQYGAMVSQQSHPLASKEDLEKEFQSILRSKKKPQRPKHWGGYLLKPSYFEFWQGRPNRLHDRIYYSFEKNSWNRGILSP
tara:strand:+ start:543 stop:1187 length:645 start_codon:yes stop_codon:yes gene_type:complete